VKLSPEYTGEHVLAPGVALGYRPHVVVSVRKPTHDADRDEGENLESGDFPECIFVGPTVWLTGDVEVGRYHLR